MRQNRPGRRTELKKRKVEPGSDKKQLWLGYLSPIARVIVGAVLVFSAATKLLHPVEFVSAVQAYEILPAIFVEPAAAVVPWIELFVGSFVILGLFTRLALAASAAMLGFFIIMMGVAFAQGKNVDCGCFVGVVSETVGPLTFVRDLVILGLVAPAYLGLPHRFGLDNWIRPGKARTVAPAIAAAALTVVTLALGISIGRFATAPSLTPPPALAAQPSAPLASKPLDQPPASSQYSRLGSATARVVISEFGDFQCPACKALAPVLKQVVAEYRGEVALVYRHFPLSYHEFAVPAALAAEAAGEQGKFWEMHDLMYADSERLSLPDLRAKAAFLELDARRFDDGLRSERLLNRVKADYEEGVRVGLKYTPWIMVGDKVVTPNSYQAIKAAVDEALKK